MKSKRPLTSRRFANHFSSACNIACSSNIAVIDSFSEIIDPMQQFLVVSQLHSIEGSVDQ